MAKKATPAESGRKRDAKKPKDAAAKRKSTAGVVAGKPERAAKAGGGKPARAKAAKPQRATSAPARKPANVTAVDALKKLMESPLVADLLAVGATAALASIAGRGLGRSAGTSGAVAAAGKAAASAMGRRLTTEVEEIRAASRAAKGSAAD